MQLKIYFDKVQIRLASSDNFLQNAKSYKNFVI